MDAPVEIVVTSRNVDVSDHFRLHITQRLVRLERYDSNMIRYDVELDHENNPRQSKASQRLQSSAAGRAAPCAPKPAGPIFTPRSTPQSPSWRRSCDETMTAAGNTTTDTSSRPPRRRRPCRRPRRETTRRVSSQAVLRLDSPSRRPAEHRCHQRILDRPAAGHTLQPDGARGPDRPTLHLVPFPALS